MKCKHCNKPFISILRGVRNFCSKECQKAHKSLLQATRQQKKRDRERLSEYNSSSVTLSPLQPIDLPNEKNGILAVSDCEGEEFVVRRLNFSTKDFKGCFDHPGIICWHMVVYGGRRREELGEAYR